MKIKLNIMILMLLPLSLYSHSLLLNIMDNDDGSIMISGGFNTGESAAGAMVRVKATSSDEILYEKRLGSEGEVSIKIPKIPYQVILDGGKGHTIVKDGIPPKEGFIKKEKEKEKEKKKKARSDAKISTSNAVIVSIIIAFILLFATIFMSARNTNKLMQEIKKKQ